MELKQLLKSWLLLSLGVTLAAHTAGGIRYESLTALGVAVLLLSVFNLVLKPLLMLFSLPFIILTFGIGIWFINALLFLFVGYIVEGFEVASFSSALWGALVVSITGAAANVLFGQTRVRVHMTEGSGGVTSASAPRRPSVRDRGDDDVIDV